MAEDTNTRFPIKIDNGQFEEMMAEVETGVEPDLAEKRKLAAEITEENQQCWKASNGEEELGKEREKQLSRLESIATGKFYSSGPDSKSALFDEEINSLRDNQPTMTESEAKKRLLLVANAEELSKFVENLARESSEFEQMVLDNRTLPELNDKRQQLIESFKKISLRNELDIFNGLDFLPSLRAAKHSIGNLLTRSGFFDDQYWNESSWENTKDLVSLFLSNVSTWKSRNLFWLTRIQDEALGIELRRPYQPLDAMEVIDIIFKQSSEDRLEVPLDLESVPEIIGDPYLLYLATGEFTANTEKAFELRRGKSKIAMLLEFDHEKEEVVYFYQDNAGGINLRDVARAGKKVDIIDDLLYQKVMGGEDLKPEEELAILDLIFDKRISGFRQRLEEHGTGMGGTGFGLSDLKERVEREHGKISVVNVRDETGKVIGARFEIRLPARYQGDKKVANN